jgi:alkylhydroperoxidase family enzyme
VVLGRSAGLTEEKIAHIGEDDPPEGVYDDAERAIVRYARASSRLDPIDDDLYGLLDAHFDDRQKMEICFTVGLSNLINRFHATFLTAVDPETKEVLGAACPLPYPQPGHP